MDPEGRKADMGPRMTGRGYILDIRLVKGKWVDWEMGEELQE